MLKAQLCSLLVVKFVSLLFGPVAVYSGVEELKAAVESTVGDRIETEPKPLNCEQWKPEQRVEKKA